MSYLRETFEPVNNIFDEGSIMTKFGCNDTWLGGNAVDGTTRRFGCNRSGVMSNATGFVIHPSHYRSSIAEGLRVYAANVCPNCDPGMH